MTTPLVSINPQSEEEDDFMPFFTLDQKDNEVGEDELRAAREDSS